MLWVGWRKASQWGWSTFSNEALGKTAVVCNRLPRLVRFKFWLSGRSNRVVTSIQPDFLCFIDKDAPVSRLLAQSLRVGTGVSLVTALASIFYSKPRDKSTVFKLMSGFLVLLGSLQLEILLIRQKSLCCTPLCRFSCPRCRSYILISFRNE